MRNHVKTIWIGAATAILSVSIGSVLAIDNAERRLKNTWRKNAMTGAFNDYSTPPDGRDFIAGLLTKKISRACEFVRSDWRDDCERARTVYYNVPDATIGDVLKNILE